MVGLQPKTVSTPTITAKSSTANLTVGDADLSVGDLFTFTNSVASDYTLTSGTPANASIVSGKVHALKAGNSVITATHSNGTLTATVNLTVVAATIPPSVTSVTITAPVAGTQKIGATGTGVANVVVAGTTPPAKTVTWTSAKAASVSVVAGTGAWKIENAATVGEKVILTATSTVDATKSDTVELTVGAPDLTGFSKDKTTGTVKSDGSDNVVVTLTGVPAKSVLGAVTATVASGKKLKATVGTGVNSNKVTISADTGAAAGTDDGDITIAVAGVTTTQTVAITVVAP